MKHLQALTNIRLAAAMLVAVTIIGLSSLTMHAPTQHQNAQARSLESIRTDRTTLLYADQKLSRCYYIEMVLLGTAESKSVSEHLKLVAAAL